MKFPYELSEQRISLLSKEDQRIYRFEHSDFFDYNTKQKCMQEYQNALLERQGYYVQEIKKDPQFNHLNESEVFETANELTLYEAENYAEQLSEFLDECILENIYTEDEAAEILTESINNFNEMNQNILNANPLSEDAGGTIGPDMTYWAKGLGGLFGGLLGLIIGLIMRGKTKMAIRQLENYMNKIVETVDDGLHKKKGRGLWNKVKTWFGKKFKKKDTSGENSGEQDTMCLRVYQETFSADIATKAMVFCKHLGLLDDNWDGALDNLKASNYTSGAYGKFINKIITPVAKLSDTK